ncbi:hypothetical protein KXV81_003734 [Aspergillus fumigatus]|uniref:Erythromycin esterase n=2 Tax=Aspergillus fumigatus TaxID=746128 RepID=Q4WJI6_ASPFU|nr:conserved hypothetical protein [Aspergillus fumigatus Af293]KAF4279750.1 hypothetical protein CNMCM8689_003102 [Aspergillus fumigatus]EAL88296.1 conserved hypothetical protein [Aspergillus fumigatus Af293]KAF4285934.1 hypothetical protein CNMCM8686_004867 [Aspergillus fumigatus]KAH1269822.1 hypothetical protein KXX45_002469 [Aspergillus fumigatus]KAH1281625.1 hypothetical protein KXX48_003685 [Aspergillus fumigatus]
MAVRRSARLRGQKASTEVGTPLGKCDVPEAVEAEPQSQSETLNDNANENHGQSTTNKDGSKKRKKLPAVMERDEGGDVESHTTARTPTKSIQTPTKPSSVGTPVPSSAKKSIGAKTPTSAITRPSHDEMHPSKVHQSTTKQADSGLILGFNPVKKDADGNVVRETVATDTPSKAKASPLSQYGTPGFEFKFACQESQLSDEAKKLMESVREDVAKIKAQMVLEKDKQDAADRGAEGLKGKDRRIAQPKGKSGRFSSAHMAEFKKMDSIANHPSAFRAAPGRFQPVGATLKRTNSKAGFNEADSRRQSPLKSTAKPSPASVAPSAKRVKQDKTDDVSTRHPTTDADKKTPKTTLPRPRSAVRSSLMTPTRASAARTSSVSLKPPRTSMIPSLPRSPVSKPAGIPHTPQTDFNPRIKSNLPTLGGLKSILRRHQPLFSHDPTKIAAGTHVAAPDFTSKFLLGASREPSVSEEPAPTPSPKKRVEFTPTTKSPVAKVDSELDQPSPSPSKITVSVSKATSDIVYPTLPVLTPEKTSAAAIRSSQDGTPTIRHVRPSNVNTQSIALPDVAGMPHGMGNKKPTTLPDIAGVPHGIGNKKRHRATEDEADTENVPPADSTSDPRSAKRLKFSAPSPAKAPPSLSPTKARTHTPVRNSSISSRTGTPASARAKSRGVLSISRLNMLAQPKHRR